MGRDRFCGCGCVTLEVEGPGAGEKMATLEGVHDDRSLL